MRSAKSTLKKKEKTELVKVTRGQQAKKKVQKKIGKKTSRIGKERTPAPSFKIGDYLIYPMQGVGKVVNISKQEVLGKSRRYYVLEIENSRMKVLIPTDKINEVGVRPIIGQKEVKKVLRLLKKDEKDTEEDWKIRYQNNMLKIKSGNIYLIAEVCRNLSKRNQDKELSLMERRLYESAYQLITNEIAQSTAMSKEDAGNLISEILD